MLKLSPATLALVLCVTSEPAFAQTGNEWRDSTDYLAEAKPTTAKAGVTVEPQQRESEAPSVEAPQRTWYGGQLLIGDAVSLSLLATGIGLAYSGEEVAPGFIWAGALSYALVPATIHVLHERPAIAVASTTLRVVLPGLGLVMGGLIECPITPDGGGGEECESGPGPVLGLSAGILVTSLLDAGLFAYDRPATEHTTESKQASQFGFTPYLSPDGKRGELRAFGTF